MRWKYYSHVRGLRSVYTRQKRGSQNVKQDTYMNGTTFNIDNNNTTVVTLHHCRKRSFAEAFEISTFACHFGDCQVTKVFLCFSHPTHPEEYRGGYKRLGTCFLGNVKQYRQRPPTWCTSGFRFLVRWCICSVKGNLCTAGITRLIRMQTQVYSKPQLLLNSNRFGLSFFGPNCFRFYFNLGSTEMLLRDNTMTGFLICPDLDRNQSKNLLPPMFPANFSKVIIHISLLSFSWNVRCICLSNDE